MNEDMSDIVDKFSSMLKNNEIPSELKGIMENLASNNTSNKNTVSSETENSNSINSLLKGLNINSSENSQDTKDSDNESKFDFDINTFIKMKSIIDAMNSQKDDPRANLLKSLKPYLKKSRKDKVDQYIKIFSMEKVFENLNNSNGGKKNDV